MDLQGTCREWLFNVEGLPVPVRPWKTAFLMERSFDSPALTDRSWPISGLPNYRLRQYAGNGRVRLLSVWYAAYRPPEYRGQSRAKPSTMIAAPMSVPSSR